MSAPSPRGWEPAGSGPSLARGTVASTHSPASLLKPCCLAPSSRKVCAHYPSPGGVWVSQLP